MRVEDAMTRNVHTVGPETSLKRVAGLLWGHGIGGMPVIDDDEQPLGVITKADILIKEYAEVPGRKPSRRMFRRSGDGNGAATKVAARTAGEAMSSPAITVDPMLPLSLVAERMLVEGINRLPVIQRGKLVGIVTRHDLVRAFARGDSEIEREIREDALAGLSWPEALELSVREGEVILRGQVDSRGAAETLPLQVRHVMGVVSVDAELTAWDPTSERKIAVAAHL